MTRQPNYYYEFGAFRVDPVERLLFRNGEAVTLTPKVFDTLLVLVENSGHILGKDEVMGKVWPDSIVEEANLTRNISVIRKSLGERPDESQYIETIPWRGYRFVADVKEVGSAVTIEEHTHSTLLIEQEIESRPDRRVSRRIGAVVAITGSAFLLALVAVVLYPSAFKSSDAAPAITSIAVLPLENLSGDASQEYFADGMTEALINKLAQVGALRVISRASVMRYKRSDKPLTEIAGELGVDAVMTGSVRRSGESVRITAQLIHGASDTHLWATDIERSSRDVLNLENEVAREIVSGVRIRLTSEESQRLASSRPIDPLAHEAFLLGQYHFKKNNEEDYELAFDHFERATKIDPGYAAAYAGLSDTLLQLGIFSARPLAEAAPAARSAALKAIELDEYLAHAHLSLAVLKYSFDWDWTGAEQDFRRALELDPGSLIAHRQYGRFLMCLGRHEEAVAEGYTALQLDPVSSEAYTDVGRFLYRARRYDEALPHLERAVVMEPRSVDANVRLADLLAKLGRREEAIAVFERAREITGDERFISFGVARVYAEMGRKLEARKLLGSVRAPSIHVAAVFAILDDKDEAFRILEQVIEERSSLLVTLKEDPHFENLHSDARWRVLLARMNFPG